MNITLLTILILIAVGIGIYLVVEYKVKKWTCVEGNCTKIINGDHSSLEKCQQQCSMKKQSFTRPKEREKRVTFSPVVDYSPTPPSISSSSENFVLVN